MENWLDPQNNRDAIGARIKTRIAWGESVLSQKRGIITDVKESDGRVFFVCKFDDGSIESIAWGKLDVDITVEAGKQYMLMSGHVVTLYPTAWGNRFIFKYSEHWGEHNQSTELIESNGVAYHYDCHCSVLKEVL